MKIRIDKKNGQKFIKAIDEAEGRATSRLLETYRLFDAVEDAEEKLYSMKIPQKARLGCTVFIEPEALPNSYKYGGQGTFASVQRYSTGWFLTGVRRDYCRTKSFGDGERSVLLLSRSAIAAIPNTYTL